MATIAYTENRPNCKLCHITAFGAFVARLQDQDGNEEEQLVMLCAECGFTRAWQAYTTKRLKGLRLEAIFKFPSDKAPPAPKAVLPVVSVAGSYSATFRFEGENYTGPLDPCEGGKMTFASEWAALDRARQISQHLARSVKKRNHWAIQTGINRVEPAHE